MGSPPDHLAANPEQQRTAYGSECLRSDGFGRIIQVTVIRGWNRSVTLIGERAVHIAGGIGGRVVVNISHVDPFSGGRIADNLPWHFVPHGTSAEARIRSAPKLGVRPCENAELEPSGHATPPPGKTVSSSPTTRIKFQASTERERLAAKREGFPKPV